jgi:hypothetical protein
VDWPLPKRLRKYDAIEKKKVLLFEDELDGMRDVKVGWGCFFPQSREDS